MNETLTFADLQDAGNAQSQLVLLAIARHADWDTGECHPSVNTLARMAKCSVNTARRHLVQLVEDGLIERETRNRADGGRTSDLLRLAGYQKWIETNRKGGQVDKPVAIQPYEATPPPNLGGPPSQDLGGPPSQQGGRGRNIKSNFKRTEKRISDFQKIGETTVRDTSEPFPEYLARMKREGKAA